MPNFDFDRLQSIKSQFESISAKSPTLYHATRVKLDRKKEQPTDCRKHWEEFLADEECFEFSSYRLPRGLVQHSSFFGDRQLLKEFTGLAAAALMEMSSSTVPLITPNREARSDRDYFIFAVYRLALLDNAKIPLDRRGSKAVSPLEMDTSILEILSRLYATQDSQYGVSDLSARVEVFVALDDRITEKIGWSRTSVLRNATRSGPEAEQVLSDPGQIRLLDVEPGDKIPRRRRGRCTAGHLGPGTDPGRLP